MEIGGFKIHTGELTGVLLAISGFITTIAAKLFGATEGFWNIYKTGFLVTGLALLGIGLFIAIFSIIKMRSSFLDLKQSIDAGNLIIILIVSIILVIAINVLIVPKLPNKPEEELRRMPPKMAAVVRQNEDNFKVFFSLSVIIAGLAICTIPTVKFLKN